jgi:hypothetical protein
MFGNHIGNIHKERFVPAKPWFHYTVDNENPLANEAEKDNVDILLR